MPRVWRLSRSPDRAWTFSGNGARLHPGRWNEEGVPVVYTSEHLSLAVVEMLVHMASTQMRLGHFAFPVDVPDDAVEILPDTLLPANWDTPDSPPSTQALGSAWARSGRSLALSVPSAVIRSERNVVLNTAHIGFRTWFEALAIGVPEPFAFDPRLLGAQPPPRMRRP